MSFKIFYYHSKQILIFFSCRFFLSIYIDVYVYNVARLSLISNCGLREIGALRITDINGTSDLIITCGNEHTVRCV